MAFTGFAETAHNLVRYEPAAGGMGDVLDEVRGKFDNLIDDLSGVVPDDANGKLAARAIHQACQACILAIIKKGVAV